MYNKIVGAIFLLIAAILYAVERIDRGLTLVAMASMGQICDVEYGINSKFTLGMAVVFSVTGIILLLIEEVPLLIKKILLLVKEKS